MKRNRTNFPLKFTVLFLIFSFLILLLFFYVTGVLYSSEYFRVRDVIGSQNLNPDFANSLLGRNIFDINLKVEASRARKSCPDCLRVRLAKVFPDRIFVEFIKRIPLARVKLYKVFCVDAEGVFFNITGASQDPKIPLITGLETRLFGVSVGKRYDAKELLVALEIIREVNKSKVLKSFQLNSVHVESLNDITLYFLINNIIPQQGFNQWQVPEKQKVLEIRISQGNILEKVAVMSGLINQEKNNLENIIYIDLRFKEPVIKFKDVK